MTRLTIVAAFGILSAISSLPAMAGSGPAEQILCRAISFRHLAETVCSACHPFASSWSKPKCAKFRGHQPYAIDE
jgi:hypothetical protein